MALQILDLSYNRGLTGQLPSGLGDLTRLTSLILVGCRFSGVITSSIGSLRELVYLSLNSNNFIGPIPPSIGNLQNLYWLDLADNQLTGTIPVSDGVSPGLDMLLQTKHFHFGRNQLFGEIPSRLFSSNGNMHGIQTFRNKNKDRYHCNSTSISSVNFHLDLLGFDSSGFARYYTVRYYIVLAYIFYSMSLINNLCMVRHDILIEISKIQRETTYNITVPPRIARHFRSSIII